VADKLGKLLPLRTEPGLTGNTSRRCPSAPEVEAEANQLSAGGTKLSKNQSTIFSILFDAGTGGLSVDEWYARAGEAGIGTTRRADLYDLRASLTPRTSSTSTRCMACPSVTGGHYGRTGPYRIPRNLSRTVT